MSGARDVLVVARFEGLRAVRTWRALALFVLYGVATCGGAYLFTRVVGLMENALARQLGVAETRVPGAMLQDLVQSESFRAMIEAMVGSAHGADQIAGVPVLAVFHLWLGFLLIPFFAAAAAAESIAIDAGSRALRFEILRTGRLELVLGRYVGQLALTGVATMFAVVGVWTVGMVAMRGNAAIPLAVWLVWLSLRIWFFSVPFVGVGVAASQLTTSPAWARVLAVGLTAGSWVAFAVARAAERSRYAAVSDVVLPLLPQGWMQGMWLPTDWLGSAVACATLGLVAAFAGYVAFSRSDL